MIEVFPTPGAPMTAILSVSTIPRGSGLQTTRQDTWKTAQQIKTSHMNCERASFCVCMYSTRTHFVDDEINKSLHTDLLSSGTFRYLFWWNTLLVASVIEWINKPTSVTAAVARSSLHSIGEQSLSAPRYSQYPHTQLWSSKTSVSNSIDLAALWIMCALRSRGYHWPFLLVTSHTFPHHLSSVCCASAWVLAWSWTSPQAKCSLSAQIGP